MNIFKSDKKRVKRVPPNFKPAIWYIKAVSH